MAGATLTTLANILKEFYEPGINEQINNEVLLFQRLETNAKDLQGNQAVVALHSGQTGGIASVGEDEALPNSGNQTWAKAVYDLTYHYGYLRITGVAQLKTRGNAGAYLQALASEVDYLRKGLTKDAGRQTYGSSDGSDGGNGLIAQCGTTTSSAVVVLASREAIDKGHLYVNQIVDIGTAADPDSLVDGEVITAVAPATPSITVTTSITTTTSNYVSRHLSATANTNAGGEMDGLEDLISTGNKTIGGIADSSAGNEYWKNIRMGNSGTDRSLTLSLLLQAHNQVRLAGGNPTVQIGSWGVQRQLFELLQSQVRYTEPETIKGGFQSLSFQGMPFIADLDAQWGRVYIFDEKEINVYSPEPYNFLDEDGNMLKWVNNKDAWEAVMRRAMNLGIKRRNTAAVLFDLTDSVGY